MLKGGRVLKVLKGAEGFGGVLKVVEGVLKG